MIEVFKKNNDMMTLTYTYDSKYSQVHINRFDNIQNNVETFRELNDFILSLKYIKWISFIGDNMFNINNILTHNNSNKICCHISDLSKFYHKNIHVLINNNNIYYNEKEGNVDEWVKIVNVKKEKQLKLKKLKKELVMFTDWTC